MGTTNDRERGGDDERLWEVGWEGHRRAQARRMAALPLAEKLRWLEEAQAMVAHLRRVARLPDETPPSPGPT